MDLSERQTPETEKPLEPLRQPDPEPAEPRGLGWVIVPALVAAVFGALIGAVMATRPGPPRLSLLESAIQGGVVGAIAGGVLGLFIWVAFPYKNAPPPPPPDAGDEKDENGAVV
jgi:hypothetical protein